MLVGTLRNFMVIMMQRLLKVYCFRFVWVLIIIVFSLSCSTLSEKDRYVKLRRSVERYASDIRWGRYDAAASFIAKSEGQASTVGAGRFEEIRVTGYEMAPGELARDNEKASITVTFAYYDTRSGRLQTLADVQHWWYNESLSRWFLDGDLPDFLNVGHGAR